jgi:23S rRNA (guanosine2251-2'-O)-methyltransferase
MKKILVLDSIRSVLNVGSIFRTADAIGINKIYLCGITPVPIDRFGRKREDLHKSALGAEESVEWESCENVLELILRLKKEGVQIISLEQSADSIDYKEINVSENCAIVLGNEVDGVDSEILKNSDVVTEIKMAGKKESLNVGVATGIVLYRFFDK